MSGATLNVIWIVPPHRSSARPKRDRTQTIRFQSLAPLAGAALDKLRRAATASKLPTASSDATAGLLSGSSGLSSNVAPGGDDSFVSDEVHKTARYDEECQEPPEAHGN